jgi:hypothetical protein
MVNAISARDPSFRLDPIIVTLKRTVHIYLYNSKLYKPDDVFAQVFLKSSDGILCLIAKIIAFK